MGTLTDMAVEQRTMAGSRYPEQHDAEYQILGLSRLA